MKKILITGHNSYIGNKFEEWLSQWPNDYQITKISLRDGTWKNMNWSQFDSILHVAGIAHNSSDKNLEGLYFSVNRDLTEEVAFKAKIDGVKHFIFLSSIIVFGTKNSCINGTAIPNPDNFYGESKLQAEKRIEKLADSEFKVAIVRPPIVYGKASKGNYPRLSKLAQKTPIFPNYENRRSMIHIDNLTQLIRLIIDNEEDGYFHPQNEEYVSTSKLVKTIAQVHNHKILQTNLFNWFINLTKHHEIINKVFGDLYYSKEFSKKIDIDYKTNTFVESIIKSEENI